MQQRQQKKKKKKGKRNFCNQNTDKQTHTHTHQSTAEVSVPAESKRCERMPKAIARAIFTFAQSVSQSIQDSDDDLNQFGTNCSSSSSNEKPTLSRAA